MEGIVLEAVFFLPLFGAVWILWRAAAYFFRAPEKTSRKTVFYVFYTIIAILIVRLCLNPLLLLVALLACGEPALWFNWGLLLLCALLKGVEVLIEERSRKRLRFDVSEEQP